MTKIVGRKIRWGILGLGKIAHHFVKDLLLVEGAELVAVGSRSLEKAKAFAKLYGAKNAYGSYEALAQCPDADIIYVATPHNFHKDNTLLCLNNGKHVLCEKPLAVNSQEVAEMVQLAQEKQLFLMEAIWTQFFPWVAVVKESIANGELGDIKILEADFGFRATYDPKSRLFNPDLAGGALLDVGIYPLFLAHTLFGKPDHITASAQFAPTGVDETTSMMLVYNKQNIIANLHCSLAVNTQCRAKIYGTKGSIEIAPRWHESHEIAYYDEKGKLTKTVNFRNAINQNYKGYAYEIDCVNNCLAAGHTECPALPLSFSAELMASLDEVRGLVEHPVTKIISA